MDAGARLLELIAERVAAGDNRYAAERRVFHEHPALVARWHAGEAGERPEPQRPAEPTHADPGTALLSLATAYERTGMGWTEARARAFAEHPALVQAWNAGQLIPKAPPRLTTTRRVRADEMIEGWPYLHLCSDEASGGGIFAIGH